MEPDTPLAAVFRLNLAQQRALEKAGLATALDLLRHSPFRYGKDLPIRPISELAKGEEVIIYGQVIDQKTSRAFRKHIPMGEITLEDQTGKIKAVWFNQPYLAKKVPAGQPARLSGKVAERQGKLYLANPEIELATRLEGDSLFSSDSEPGAEKHLIPVYPETYNLSSNWFYHAIKRVLKSGLHQTLPDPIPPAILERYHLPGLATALVWIHAPKTEADARAARKRFAFEEIFLIQLTRLRAKRDYQAQGAFRVKARPDEIKNFLDRFPFAPTGAQERAIKQIMFDLEKNQPMTRLLEGDVGSGKTAVAATTAFAVVRAGLEVAYMVPTEILARQHFESFIKYFSHLPVQIGLITGSGCYKFPSKINPSGWTNISRSQLLKWVAGGEIPILIGTHALIQETVKFKNLAYVIIDEQHRFGVMQRARLTRKNGERAAPHLLSMTATPIPRTLALTLYGDLDLSLLDEVPAGRKPIKTEIVGERERAAAYQKIREEIKLGRQAYVICPRIDEPDPTKELALNVKSAKAEAKKLQAEIFPEFSVGLVHSKLNPKEKEEVMAEFAGGKTQILVATSVIEVGVNVPNATIIIIEGAERFGLAQLHQLRGRVLRSSHQAYCYLFTSNPSPLPSSPKGGGAPSPSGRAGGGARVPARLRALQTAKNGFELAELDLELRGAGSLAGTQQWGISDIGMEAIKNLKMVEAARTEAQNLLAADPALTNFPLLRERLASQTKVMHWE